MKLFLDMLTVSIVLLSATSSLNLATETEDSPSRESDRVHGGTRKGRGVCCCHLDYYINVLLTR